jgi:hypothetical protein
MTDWAQLTHAYGSAEDIPGLLELAVPDMRSEVWTELWSRLCHQGTVYPASFAALPVLTLLARQWSPADRVMPLILAGDIVASTDRPHDARDPRVSYGAEVSELIGLTEQALQNPGLRLDPATYIYLLQALLGLEGVEVWGDRLDGVNDEEYEVPCPSCGTGNFVVFGKDGHFTTLDSMYMNKPDGERIPLQPKQPHDLGPLGSRLHARVLADGHPDLADKLTYVFGSAYCVDCGTLFQVDQAVVAARWES